MSKCPICGGDAKPRQENPSAPFCNARCKMIDLGKWMNEEYGVPVEGSPDEEDRKSDPDGEDLVRH